MIFHNLPNKHLDKPANHYAIGSSLDPPWSPTAARHSQELQHILETFGFQQRRIFRDPRRFSTGFFLTLTATAWFSNGIIRPGKDTKSYWKWLLIVPMKNGGFSHSHVTVYQRVQNYNTCWLVVDLPLWKINKQMMEFVSWDGYIFPIIWWQKKCSTPPISLVHVGME